MAPSEDEKDYLSVAIEFISYVGESKEGAQSGAEATEKGSEYLKEQKEKLMNAIALDDLA